MATVPKVRKCPQCHVLGGHKMDCHDPSRRVFFFRFEVRHDRNEHAEPWSVMRVNAIGQEWQVATYRTSKAAEHAAAALRWAEVMDRVPETSVPG